MPRKSLAIDEDTYFRLPRVEEALVAALKARGHEVKDRQAVVLGKTIPFWIYEPDRRTRVPIKRGEMGYSPGATKQLLIASGKLVLIAKHHAGERRWSDKPGRPLEDQVESIAVAFEGLAQAMEQWRLECEQRDREYEESLAQAAERYRWDLEAAERPRLLKAMAADWRKSARLRAFLDEFDARLVGPPSAALAAWLKWARTYVEGIDPFSPDRMAELEEHAAILATPKVGEEDPYEEEWRALGLLDRFIWEEP